MPALQVRDLPDEVYNELVESARRDHRSLAQQTTAILEEHFRVVRGGLTAPGEIVSPDGRYRVRREPPEERRARKLGLFAMAHEDNARHGLNPDALTDPLQVVLAARDERDEELACAAGVEAAAKTRGDA